MTRDLRINPRLDLDYRRQKAGVDFLVARPRLGVVYRAWKLTFDVDLALEYRRNFGSGANTESGSDMGYALSAGIRLDF